MSRAHELAERRKQICKQHGRKVASFRTLAEWTGISTTTIHRTLKETESEFTFDREGVMDQVEAALDEIKRAAEEDEARNPRLFGGKRAGRQADRQKQRRTRDNPHAGAGLFGSDAA